MFFTEVVHFDSSMPSIPEVLSALANTTGLNIIYNYDDCILEEVGTENFCIFFKKDTDYCLNRLSLKMNYIYANTIYSLISLGGHYNNVLPDWVGRKWEFIEDKFDENYYLK